MTKQYKIKGMTCGGCIATLKKGLEKVEGVSSAEVQLASPQGTLELSKDVELDTLQNAIGHYSIEEVELPETKKEV